jgi:hypothetical protein
MTPERFADARHAERFAEARHARVYPLRRPRRRERSRDFHCLVRHDLSTKIIHGDSLSMADSSGQRWYVRDHVAGQPRQVWRFVDQTAARMGVTNPEIGPGAYFKAELGEDFLDCIRRQTPWLDPGVTEGLFHAMALGPGEFYSRIARPLALASEPSLWSPWILTDKAYVARARDQLTLLVRKLEVVCQTVQPSENTLEVYGHEIRNLLILAASEVEMHWRGILSANRPSASKFNSNDYVKLVDPLKLLDYEISFYDFPDLDPVRPFAGWSKADPTKTLKWYDAYHGVKHNREEEFQRGTLRHAFEAVSACIALMIAQFGPTALNADLSSFVGLAGPDWPVCEMYISGFASSDCTLVHHPSL